MSKIINYELLTSPSEAGLEAYVIGRMTEGWQPLGGAFIRGDGCLYQTMVKYEELRASRALAALEVEALKLVGYDPRPTLNIEGILDKARLSPSPKPAKL